MTFNVYHCLVTYRCDSTARINQPSTNPQSRNVVADSSIQSHNNEKGTINSQLLQGLAAEEKTLLKSIAKSFAPRLQNRGASVTSHQRGHVVLSSRTGHPFAFFLKDSHLSQGIIFTFPLRPFPFGSYIITL